MLLFFVCFFFECLHKYNRCIAICICPWWSISLSIIHVSVISFTRFIACMEIMYDYEYDYVYLCICVCVSVCLCICVSAYLCICVFVYLYICVSVYLCLCNVRICTVLCDTGYSTLDMRLGYVQSLTPFFMLIIIEYL